MTQTRTYRDRGIVLRGRALGEADRVLSIFTQTHGKIEAVAKAIRRPGSRLAGRLEMASEVELELHRGRKLDVITAAELLHAYWQPLLVPERFAAATMTLELVDTVSPVDDPNPALYPLLQGMLSALGSLPEPLELLPRFILRLMATLGVAPETEECVRCGADLTIAQKAWVDTEGGGLACPDCQPDYGDRTWLERPEHRLFAALGRPQNDSRPVALRGSPRVAAAVDAFLIHYTVRRPRSEAALNDFLGQISL